ncbi:MAG TPA: response regulator [Stellaceae bacterium]|nr:response regulator [Stellaceae bacterium]
MDTAPLARLLIVDDEPALMRALCDTLHQRGYQTAGFTAPEAALDALRKEPFDLLLTDLSMPGMDGVALLAAALKIDPHLVAIMMTGQGTIRTAVEAMQAGALDYILKPFKLSEILPVLSRAVGVRRLRSENLELRNTVAIHELNQAIAHTLDLNVLLDKIVDAAYAQLEGDEASLMLLSDDGSSLYVAAVRGDERDTLLGSRIAVGDSIAGAVAARREPLILDGSIEHDPPLVPRYPRAEIRSAVSMPIMTRGRLIGVLNVNSTRRYRAFSLGQIKGLNLFTSAAASAIEAARLYEEQRRSNTRYRKLLNQFERAERLAQMGTDARDLRTGEREWSAETYRIYGVSRENFAATYDDVLALVHPDDRPPVVAAREQVAKGVRPGPLEYRIIRPDGSVRHIRREWEIVRDDAGEPIEALGTIHDVTERRNTEQQLRQAQKMEAIGNLTGGMAHDFNNLLGIIIGNLDLARDHSSSDAELRELIGEALEAAWHGADLTRRLLAFARKQPLRPARIDINDLVGNTARLLRRLLGEDIEIALDLDEPIWPVTADPAQLEASIANLATNARDAMPRGGRLMIRTANRQLDGDYAASHPDVIPGDFAMIEVSDTGTGMSAEIMGKIFEPFFTTKASGKGTGLGLSMVFGFLRQSGGHVNVYSEPGIGTTFRLYLPRTQVAAEVADSPNAQPIVPGAGETLLVVEDNAGLRRVVARQLRDLGYRILESDHAAAALAILEHEPVDLLLTDIVMPGGIDGVELVRSVLERWPTLKIVLTSGFPHARIDENGSVFAGLPLLSKPYSKDELASVLRTALDG